jgi:phosphoglycolate phosphatase-like HAD superfamily hydrolase
MISDADAVGVAPTLVIFDIDGTLLDSTAVHHATLTDALEHMGFDPHVKPWSVYRHYTDSGVLDELCEDRRGTGATDAELSSLDALMSQAFTARVRATPLVEIPGAKALLADLAATSDIHVCFATGSTRGTAEAKLTALGLDPSVQLMATCSEFISRRQIVESVLKRAILRLGTDCNVVVLGDGVWDKRTAALLGLSFVGVETGLHKFDTGLIVKDLTQLSPSILRSVAG